MIAITWTYTERERHTHEQQGRDKDLEIGSKRTTEGQKRERRFEKGNYDGLFLKGIFIKISSDSGRSYNSNGGIS